MLGDRIKLLRKARGLNQVELADKLKVSKQAVSNWENNNILSSIEILIRIATFFGVSTDYLLGLDSRTYLEITKLSLEEISHLQQIINDIARKK